MYDYNDQGIAHKSDRYWITGEYTVVKGRETKYSEEDGELPYPTILYAPRNLKTFATKLFLIDDFHTNQFV